MNLFSYPETTHKNVSPWFFSPSSACTKKPFLRALDCIQSNMHTKGLSVHNNNTRGERYSHSFMCHLLSKLSGHVGRRVGWLLPCQ